MTDTLILYPAKPESPLRALDNAAAVQALKVRFPGAVAEAVTPESINLSWVGPIWILDLSPAGPYGDGLTVVDPTPTSSVMMQVWELMYPTDQACCPECGEKPNKPPPRLRPWYVVYIDYINKMSWRGGIEEGDEDVLAAIFSWPSMDDQLKELRRVERNRSHRHTLRDQGQAVRRVQRRHEEAWGEGLEEVLTLAEKIDEWKSASGLIGSSGDPADIEPEHLEADLRKRDRKEQDLLEKLAHARLEINRRSYAMLHCDGGCKPCYDGAVRDDVAFVVSEPEG